MAALGRHGWGFGFPLVPDGRLPRVSGADAVAQALRMLLLTEPGERIARPRYGCGLRRFLFAPNTVATRTLIRQTIEDAIAAFEPRVDLDEVAVRTDPEAATRVLVDVRYRLVGDTSGTPQRLAFPLSLQGQEV